MALVHGLAKESMELIEFIIIKSNYFQNAQKGESFLDDFEALVREIVVRALVLQNHPKSIRTSASKGHFEGSEFKIIFASVLTTSTEGCIWNYY
jgi:hypothetical protein